jgi:hypothetical protein
MSTLVRSISIALFILILLAHPAYPQTKPFVFGKIDTTELLSNTCKFDSTASSYFIGDVGKSYFKYSENAGTQVIYERHFQIKICKKSGLNWGVFEIPVFKQGNFFETINELKGYTYNLEKGKVVQTPLYDSSKFEEKKNEYVSVGRISFPNVKIGSIIELKYTIVSDFYNIRGWQFQYQIPVGYSEYELKIPDFLTYVTFLKGFADIKLQKSKEQVRMEIFNNHRMQYETFNNNVYKYYGNIIPPFGTVPYIDNPANYTSSLEFAIAKVHMPGAKPVDYRETWDSISKKIFENESYVKQLENYSFLVDDLLKVVLNNRQPEQKMLALFDFVRKRIKWTRYMDKFLSKSLETTYYEKTGNCADINLLLLMMLKVANLQAYPVILSSRESGKINLDYPMPDKFNYVIVAVDIEGKRYLLDATEPYSPVNMLPERCLNGKGMLKTADSTYWIDLNPESKFVQTTTVEVKINKHGENEGTCTIINKDYAAQEFRDIFHTAPSQFNYIVWLEKQKPGLRIQRFEFEDTDNINKPVMEKYDIMLENLIENKHHTYKLCPLLFERMKENPLKLDERNFPVDFSYPREQNYSLKLAIPEGYEVDSLPAKAYIILPDNSGSYDYTSYKSDNYIYVNSKLSITKSVFEPEEYEFLKDSYERIVKAQAEKIVLKKVR